jgi:hypothetical protein
LPVSEVVLCLSSLLIWSAVCCGVGRLMKSGNNTNICPCARQFDLQEVEKMEPETRRYDLVFVLPLNNATDIDMMF